MGELISKKEVLETYKISYGALYRWKRMGLIPEEWFIKKSAVTGQETFFEKDVICERIEMILKLKDTLSLEEIADSFRETKTVNKERMIALVWSGGEVHIPLSALERVLLIDNDTVSDMTGDILKITGGNNNG